MPVSAAKGMVPGHEQADSAGKDHSFQWKHHKAFRELEQLSRGVQISNNMSKHPKKKKILTCGYIKINLNWTQILASENYHALTPELKILTKTCTANVPPRQQKLLLHHTF